jgi:hypothetical protein
VSAQATVDFDDAAFTVEFSRSLIEYKGLECKLNVKVDEYNWIDCLYDSHDPESSTTWASCSRLNWTKQWAAAIVARWLPEELSNGERNAQIAWFP